MASYSNSLVTLDFRSIYQMFQNLQTESHAWDVLFKTCMYENAETVDCINCSRLTHQCFSCDVCFLVISMCIFVSVRSSWVVYLGSPCKFMNPDEDNRNGLYTHANEKNAELDYKMHELFLFCRKVSFRFTVPKDSQAPFKPLLSGRGS